MFRIKRSRLFRIRPTFQIQQMLRTPPIMLVKLTLYLPIQQPLLRLMATQTRPPVVIRVQRLVLRVKTIQKVAVLLTQQL